MNTIQRASRLGVQVFRVILGTVFIGTGAANVFAASSFSVEYEHDIEYVFPDSYGYESGSYEDHDLFYRDGTMWGTVNDLYLYDYDFSSTYGNSYSLHIDTYNADGTSQTYSESDNGSSTNSPAPYYQYPGANHYYNETYGGGHDSHYTRVKIHTYDEPGSDDDRLYKIHVQAYDLDTFLAIPASAISVAGKTLDSNGNVVHGIPQESSLDVTPTVTGHANYSFTVGTTQHVLKIKRGVSFEQDISDDQNLETIVGRRIKLKAVIEPALSGTVEYQWSVGGERVDNYDAGDPNPAPGVPAIGGPVPLTNLTSQLVSYVWTEEGDSIEVSCSVKLQGGTSAAVTTKFDVVKPTSSMTLAEPEDDIEILGGMGGSGPTGVLLSFGDPPPLAPIKNGITLLCNYQVPVGYTGAQAYFTQIVESTLRKRGLDGKIYKLEKSKLLDNGLGHEYPWSAAPPAMQAPPNSALVSDSPAEPSSESVVQASDNFSLYLMWKPSGGFHPEENIAVPLRVAKWHWGGDATQDSTTKVWTLNSSPTNGKLDSTAATSQHPSWNGTIARDANFPDDWEQQP